MKLMLIGATATIAAAVAAAVSPRYEVTTIVSGRAVECGTRAGGKLSGRTSR